MRNSCCDPRTFIFSVCKNRKCKVFFWLCLSFCNFSSFYSLNNQSVYDLKLRQWLQWERKIFYLHWEIFVFNSIPTFLSFIIGNILEEHFILLQWEIFAFVIFRSFHLRFYGAIGTHKSSLTFLSYLHMFKWLFLIRKSFCMLLAG